MAEDERSLQDAVQLFNEGSFGDAATVLEQLLTRDGDDVTARGWLALAHFRNGSFLAAAHHYRILADQPNPKASDIYSLGSCYEKLGQLGEAEAWYGKAAETDPTYTKAVEARNRLAGQHSAANAQKSATEVSSPTQEEAAYYQKLQIPSDPDELAKYIAAEKRQRQQEWWIEHWYRYPWFVRITRLVVISLGTIVVLVIGFYAVRGFYDNIITRDEAPNGQKPPQIVTVTETEFQTVTDTVTETTTDTSGGSSLEGDPVAGKDVFITAGFCGDCHTLADAGSTGTSGPDLDDAQPSEALVIDRVTDGAGAMPSYEGKLSEQEVADVAAYVASATSGP